MKLDLFEKLGITTDQSDDDIYHAFFDWANAQPATEEDCTYIFNDYHAGWNDPESRKKCATQLVEHINTLPDGGLKAVAVFRLMCHAGYPEQFTGSYPSGEALDKFGTFHDLHGPTIHAMGTVVEE